MKYKFLIAMMLSFVFTFDAAAQVKTKPVEPKAARRILRFAKPEYMFQILDGKWSFGNVTCAEPYIVTVSGDRKSIKFQYTKPQKWSDGKEHDSFVYNVLEVGKYYIRTQIEGEPRKTDDGKPVAWDFMFISEDEFVWHRTDWQDDAQGVNITPSITRCKQEKQTPSVK